MPIYPQLCRCTSVSGKFIKSINMNKLYLLSFIFLTASIMKLCGQQVEISGKIQGISDSTELRIVFLPLIFGEDIITKKVNHTNGNFSIVSDLDLSMWHLVRIDCNEFNKTAAPNICDYLIHLDIFFFIQLGDNIHVKAEKQKFGVKFQTMGNSIGNQQNEFNKEIFKLEQSYAELDNKKSTVIVNPIENKINKLKKKLYRLNH